MVLLLNSESLLMTANKTVLKPEQQKWNICINMSLGTSNMLLLINVILIFWVSCAHGQGRTCDFPEIKHGNIYDENRYKQSFPVAVGKYFYYSCHYSFVSRSQSLWTAIMCTEEGWSPAPKCLRQCFFPWVENGHSASSGQTHREGDTVQIVCDKGYSLPNNQSNITCIESGWSIHPKCNSTEKCGPPPPINNGDITSFLLKEYPTGSRVEYQCQSFYELQGSKDIACINGQWSERPRCSISKGTCGPPPPIDNGDITTFPLPAYPPGSTVEYQCQFLHQLQGNRIITCWNGEWSKPPKCLDACVISEEKMEKHNIELRWRDEKKVYSRTGDVVEFVCKPGYRRKRDSTEFRATCQEGKLEYPTCERQRFNTRS
nr:complement factor H-related protein 1-like isoform X2 [Equus asinus]